MIYPNVTFVDDWAVIIKKQTGPKRAVDNTGAMNQTAATNSTALVSEKGRWHTATRGLVTHLSNLTEETSGGGGEWG